MPSNQLLPSRVLFLSITLAVFLFGCGPKIDSSGYIRDLPVKDLVTINKSSREDVRTALGSPSAQSSFGDETWYYITDRKEAYAFMKPEVVEQQVARITFNQAGTVSKIEDYNLQDSQDVSIAKRTTPTEGHTLGFFEQVLGNIGRFNAPNNKTAAPGRKPN